MGLKSLLISPFAKKIVANLRRQSDRAIDDQWLTLNMLVSKAKNTKFGRDHHFDKIQGYVDFKKNVPIRDYESFAPYIDLIKEAKPDILWPGIPLFFAKTSGTTSGTKYIPLSKESTPHHVDSARNSLFTYMVESGNHRFFDGKMLYLSGSPILQKTAGINTGRLSGIVNHQIPGWVKGNKLPSHEVNCIDAWEDKVSAIVRECAQLDVRVIGGIPPWVQMFYEELLAYTGKKQVIEVFPNLSLFVYGGVNFEPYRSQLENLVGKSIDSIETFPASEGFFAFQDKHPSEGLLLNTNAGMFFEFIPLTEIHSENPPRLSLAEVETGINYALIVTSNAGLWAYNIGDTVEFTSLRPPRLKVTGRIKHFISAFGEHVIGKEVDEAMMQTSSTLGFQVIEFTVAPQVNPAEGLPYHEWFIELTGFDGDIKLIEEKLDVAMQEQNIYYRDLIEGKILRPVKVTLLKPHAFRDYMQSIGKLGGQNKVPRLSNDRILADALQPYHRQ
ncbi:MAG: GH3 auxin-responsive promoter family protein [Saprospiraceae bacterium]|nr:GH3 auxin-responsive promoter family protein [Saprospiraceae bacterium]